MYYPQTLYTELSKRICNELFKKELDIRGIKYNYCGETKKYEIIKKYNIRNCAYITYDKVYGLDNVKEYLNKISHLDTDYIYYISDYKIALYHVSRIIGVECKMYRGNQCYDSTKIYMDILGYKIQLCKQSNQGAINCYTTHYKVKSIYSFIKNPIGLIKRMRPGFLYYFNHHFQHCIHRMFMLGNIEGLCTDIHDYIRLVIIKLYYPGYFYTYPEWIKYQTNL